MNLPVSATQQIMRSIDSLFESYSERLQAITRISTFVHGKDELLDYFLSGGGYSSFMTKELFSLPKAQAKLDSEFWSKVINLTDVLQFMSATKRNEWNEMIHENKTPAFERDTVIGTIKNMLLSRESFFAEKVDGIFRNLSGEHVTNSPQGFRQRMIVGYVVESWGTGSKYYSISHRKAEFLHDLRSVIAKLMGRDEPKCWDTQRDLRLIIDREEYGTWQEFDGGAFRVKLHKAGTAHLEVHSELALQLNQILSSIHPNVIASTHRTSTVKAKEHSLRRDLIPFEVASLLLVIADSFIRNGPWIYLSHDLKLEVKNHLEDIFRFLGGEEERSEERWKFDYDVAPVLTRIARTGSLPEKVSHQFYPTPKDLAGQVLALADIDSTDYVLEPSAGHGALVEGCPREQTRCVEVDPVNCAILKQKGFHVINEDFLNWNTLERFSKVVMNPPFADGRAVSHVKKAWELLLPGGKLVAVLPASLRNKEIIPKAQHTYSPVIENTFKDTGVRVVLLELEKEVA